MPEAKVIKGHESNEISGAYRCQKLVREWVDSPQYPSSLAIRRLHAELFKDSDQYSERGIVPFPTGTFRNTDVNIGGHPDNFVVKGMDVDYMMNIYTTELDQRMDEELNIYHDLNRIVHNAAWAYYAFERIHPFLDGNGRIGRLIISRILKKYGLRDLLFHDSSWKREGKSEHLESMEQTAHANSLDPVELYLLKALQRRYPSSEMPNGISKKVNRLILDKEEKLNQRRSKNADISNIWPPFKEYGLE